MSQGSKKKKGIALALVLLLVMSALAVVVFGKGYIRNKNRGRSSHVISASSAEQIAERIISDTSLVGVVKLQNEQVGNYYGVPVAIIKNSAVYKSSSALSADEIAVFRVSSEAEKKIAASAVDGRLSDCRSSYSTLSSDENRKIDNCLVEVSGDYVIMVICGDPVRRPKQYRNFINKGCKFIMKLGIVGLPNVGKSTLFNAITNAGAEVANYAFCTIEPNVGVVAVPDYRLDELAKMYSPKKITPAVIEFVDIAGLVKGASKGEGLGNKFLSHIREVDAVIHVVRCFDNDDIMHVSGSVDPKRDIETINLELILSDLEILDRRIDRTAKAAKGDKSLLTELEFLKRLKTELENGVSARAVEADDDEKAILADIGLLSAKPVIYACNMSEDDFASNIENNERYKAVCEIAKAEGAEVLPICAELEAEISSLSKEEKEMFLSDAGIESGGLDMLIQRSYSLLGLISYLTAGEPEVRAWTIKKGTKAPQAAGKIHSDFERGFIRAEVISFDELMACGSMQAAKEKGKIRSEGKDYVMQDGDIVLFRFNV